MKGEISQLCQQIATDTVGQQIRLHESVLGDESILIQAFSRALAANTCATSLDLFSNHLGDEGAQAIAQALTHHPRIHTLLLTDNHITNRGAEHLAGLLQKNQHVTTIDLAHNVIGNKGVSAIVDAILENPRPTTLKLTGNPLSKAAILTLERLQSAIPGSASIHPLFNARSTSVTATGR